MSTCPACGAAPLPERVATREMMLALRERFTYCRCGACRSLWLEDPPSELSRYYPDDYYSQRIEVDDVS